MALSVDQVEIVKNLIRRNARILQRERFKALRYINRLMWAIEASIPDEFLMPFSSNLRQAIDWNSFDESTLPPGLAYLFNKIGRCSDKNLKSLDSFGARILKEYNAASRDTVLAGEGAALAGLYHDAGAFPTVNWEGLMENGLCANGGKPRKYGSPLKAWSEPVHFGNSQWRKPKPALLITFLASRVGDPSSSPIPPIWPHLGLALLLHKDSVSINEVLDIGSRLEQRNEVERGVAIASHLFTEFEEWVDFRRLSIPKWERKLAIPIAARRITIGERD
jgi:hypothetical protein